MGIDFNSAIIEISTICRLILESDLDNKKLSLSDDAEENKGRYYQVIKPAIETFKEKNQKLSPNQFISLFLKNYLEKNNLSDSFDYQGFAFYGQKINSYVWGAIAKKDTIFKDRKISRYPQLYILINQYEIRFGFGYGNLIKNSSPSINKVRSNQKIAETIHQIISDFPNLKIYQNAEGNVPLSQQHSLSPTNSITIQEKWTKDILIVSSYSIQNLPENIIDKIGATFDILREIFIELSGISQNISYWRLSPGKNGIYWNVWRDKNFCSLGIGQYKPYFEELLKLTDKNSFRSYLIETSQNIDSEEINSGISTSHQNTIWSFFHEMKTGDVIIASTGKSRIYGVGTIKSDLIVNDSEEYPIIREIQWDYVDLDIPIPIEVNGNFIIALNRLTSDDYSKIIRIIEQKFDYSDEEQEIEIDDPMVNLLHRKGQIILYGPPGTGKTYHVQDLIHKKRLRDIKITTNELSNIFWMYLDHYNFPDFSTINIDTSYTYQWATGRNYKESFDKISVGDILICFGWKDYKIVGIAQCVSKATSSFQYQFLLLTDGPTYNTLLEDSEFSRSNILKTGNKPRIAELDHSCLERIQTLANIPPDAIQIESQIKEKRVNNTEFITFHQSFSYEEFIEGLRPITDSDGRISYSVKEGIFKELCRTAYNTLLSFANIEKRWDEDHDIPVLTDEEATIALSSLPKVPFYLVIDEINRGDISRIFGELITLLEKDKRLLAPHEITTRLPSSRTRFGIPPNLYLIGTMNTADKSIALIDIALRRRFGFIEMMPDYDLLSQILSSDDESLLEVFSIAIALLRTINKRILEEHDREHQIGHSFLLKLKEAKNREQVILELTMIWYHEIIPLLHEYFYDAPKKLYKVIGPEFMKSDPKCIYFYPEKEGDSFLTACKSISKGFDLNGISSSDAL